MGLPPIPSHRHTLGACPAGIRRAAALYDKRQQCMGLVVCPCGAHLCTIVAVTG